MNLPDKARREEVLYGVQTDDVGRLENVGYSIDGDERKIVIKHRLRLPLPAQFSLFELPK